MASNKHLELCSACDELLLPPIYQCNEGHLFCNCCLSKLDTCPNKKCGLPVTSKIRNSYLERQIEDMTFECKHCCLTLPLLSFKDHEMDCPLRKQSFCSSLGLPCQSQLILSEIIPHLKVRHGLTGVELVDPSTLIEIRQCVDRFTLDSKDVEWMPHFIKIGEKLFFVKTLLEPELECVSWVIYAAGSHSWAKEMFGAIRLSSFDSGTSTMEWYGKVNTLYSEKLEGMLRVHLATLKELDGGSEPGSKLKWKIHLQIYFGGVYEGTLQGNTGMNVVVVDDAVGEGSSSSKEDSSDFITLMRSIRYHFKLFMEVF